MFVYLNKSEHAFSTGYLALKVPQNVEEAMQYHFADMSSQACFLQRAWVVKLFIYLFEW